jgi:hypothetical protein
MIVCLHGTFGAGKTPTAEELAGLLEAARQVLDHVGGTLVIPRTVLVRECWVEIRGEFAAAFILTHHFLLHADQETLVRGIEQDTASNRRWRLEHLPKYWMALSLLREETVVLDTAELVVADVARLIRSTVAA